MVVIVVEKVFQNFGRCFVKLMLTREQLLLEASWIRERNFFFG